MFLKINLNQIWILIFLNSCGVSFTSNIKVDLVTKGSPKLVQVNLPFGQSEKICGLEVGVVNFSHSLCGLGIGIVNFTSEIRGLQLGLINFQFPDGSKYSPQIGIFNINSGFQFGLGNSKGVFQLGLINADSKTQIGIINIDGKYQFGILNICPNGRVLPVFNYCPEVAAHLNAK